MSIQRRTFSADRLVRVARVEDIPGTTERLHIGDRVRLNSGGPVMLVVDIDGCRIVTATPNHEYMFARPCLTLLA